MYIHKNLKVIHIYLYILYVYWYDLYVALYLQYKQSHYLSNSGLKTAFNIGDLVNKCILINKSGVKGLPEAGISRRKFSRLLEDAGWQAELSGSWQDAWPS